MSLWLERMLITGTQAYFFVHQMTAFDSKFQWMKKTNKGSELRPCLNQDFFLKRHFFGINTKLHAKKTYTYA